jgi:hypothetical protein
MIAALQPPDFVSLFFLTAAQMFGINIPNIRGDDEELATQSETARRA